MKIKLIITIFLGLGIINCSVAQTLTNRQISNPLYDPTNGIPISEKEFGKIFQKELTIMRMGKTATVKDLVTMVKLDNTIKAYQLSDQSRAYKDFTTLFGYKYSKFFISRLHAKSNRGSSFYSKKYNLVWGGIPDNYSIFKIIKAPLSECIELNNKGKYMMDDPKNEQGGLIKAIDLFNEAIKCNPNYFIAYINLSNAYDFNKDYSKELAAYNKALILCNNPLVLLTNKAVIFEKMNLPDSAKRIYQLARQGFTDSLTIHSKNINFINGFIKLIALTEGKEAALKELDRQTALNPELKSKMAYDYFIYQNFDKKAYMYHLTQEIQ